MKIEDLKIDNGHIVIDENKQIRTIVPASKETLLAEQALPELIEVAKKAKEFLEIGKSGSSNPLYSPRITTLKNSIDYLETRLSELVCDENE